ncbi:MAG: hypothetical protein ACTHOE_00510 [Conexibacter sp.]
MRARSLLAWIAVGLVGLALAAGVTYAATQLSSQRIGLSAEPPSAGEELAPHARTTTTPRHADVRRNRTGAPRQHGEEHNERRRGNGSGDQDD